MNNTLSIVAKVTRGLGEPALLLDVEMSLVEANASFAELCGVRLRHLGRDGRAPFDLLQCETEDLRERAREALLRRATVRLGELNVRTPEGSRLTVYQTFTPVEDIDGAQVGLLITYRNVSDESRLQEHFRELLNLEKQRAELLETAVEARTKDLMLALEQVTHLSRVDALTGVLNRRSFTEQAEREVRLAERSGRTVGLILLDLDHFKAVNDRHGHLAGDRVLKSCAAAIANALVQVAVVGRFGGEEFVALVLDESADAVLRMAGECCAAIRELPYAQIVPGALGHLTVSAGVATFPSDARSLDELILRADQALYTAKDSGRDCVQAYHSGLSRAPSRMPIVARRALILDVSPASARGLVAGVGASALCEVVATSEAFRQRYASGEFAVIIAAHQLGTSAGEDALHDSVVASPEALRILVIESEAQYAEVNVGLPNAIDLCLLRADVDRHLRNAIDDGLTRREVSRERLLTLSRRSLGGWSRHVRELRAFLDSGQIGFHFQPIVRLRDGARHAHEMLCRPAHPLFSSPMILVEACLRSNLILEFGRLVRRAAVATLLGADLHGDLFVNLHPAELTDPEFDRSIPDELIGRIVFEINERASVRHVTDSLSLIHI